MDTVLVAYATKNGSTGQVAQAIADRLRGRGASVEVAPTGRIRHPVDRYDLVVLGGALYSGRWHAGAHRFLKRHRGELGTTPVAVFGMGPRRATDEAWHQSRAQLDRALAKRSWLRPAAVAVFGGVDPPGNRAHRDLRDWSAIGAWADALLTDAVADVGGGRRPETAAPASEPDT